MQDRTSAHPGPKRGADEIYRKVIASPGWGWRRFGMRAVAGILAIPLSLSLLYGVLYLLMSLVTVNTPLWVVMLNLTLMGDGMGLSVPAFMIAVQNGVDRRNLGTATATLQFSRVIGGALGVSVMGLILSLRLAANLKAAGADRAAMSLQDLMRPLGAGSAAADATLRGALTSAVESVFVAAFAAAVVGLVVTAFTPNSGIRLRG